MRAFTLAALTIPPQALSFLITSPQLQTPTPSFTRCDKPRHTLLHSSVSTDTPPPNNPATTTTATNNNTIVTDAKSELLSLASSTNRGFSSKSSERKRAKELADLLSRYNPTPEPARTYYATTNDDEDHERPTLSGKWTLVYTDAPDITSLDGGGRPLQPSKLGRIGQECRPPYISNVIEWTRPDWTKSLVLPFAKSSSDDDDDSRVLQKVVCQASSTPEKPLAVDLTLVGLDLVGYGDDGPAGLLKTRPVELRGVLTVPFGRFTVLYLDEEMRIIRTYQNYLAVNVRNEEDW
eukprot:CAMPEP_0172502728 /NCGR_PEP_ID=MMETSP1066-20121228/162289_1 /TAXON_ID=671091 /ORGANISM="Coscinodiscus wailesii, Strain CCMP2513" /LENGTH=292 /DNA_ID=CAMNT_0013278087 /DNA_START=34 /DNA_END=909 /DNA_ORIENTATION=-